MRRRFLHALKGNDHNENKKLDRNFSYYEERKSLTKHGKIQEIHFLS